MLKGRRRQIVSIIALGYAAYYLGVIVKKPRVALRNAANGGAHPTLESFARHSNILAQPYWPTLWAINRHVSTLAGLFIRGSPRVSFRRELVTMVDGGQIALDWVTSNSVDASSSAPLVFVLPGLTGTSEANYIRQLVTCISEQNLQCVVLNNRGLFGSPLLVRWTYISRIDI
jgi:abhydrolase domain-containing protein 1/3